MPNGIAATSRRASGSTLCCSRWLPRSTPAFHARRRRNGASPSCPRRQSSSALMPTTTPFAEANSLRQEAAGFRRAVEHSSRQLVYNVWSLKLRMEAANTDGKEVSARAVADFWIHSVRIAAGNEHFHKKNTFDTCLTLYNRICSIPECEALVAAD